MAARRAKRKQKRKGRMFRPGFDRTGGFFGASVELKFHDLDVNDATVAAGATIAEDSVLAIAQGVGESERIGRKMMVRSIGWRFNVKMPSSSNQNSTGDIVRVILYQDKQTNGAAAVATDILESADYQSFNNLANKSRFLTLMDRTYVSNAAAGSGRGTTDTLAFGKSYVQDTFFKSVSIPVEYDSTTGAITEMRSNNIGVLLLSKEGIAGFDSKMRIRFEG